MNNALFDKTLGMIWYEGQDVRVHLERMRRCVLESTLLDNKEGMLEKLNEIDRQMSEILYNGITKKVDE